MAKFFGVIGYGEMKETRPGVWEEAITERDYSGDVIQFIRRSETGEHLNDDLNINNKISIVADPFACENFSTMRYIVWMGARWKITNVEVLYPRLILTVGGVYHGNQD